MLVEARLVHHVARILRLAVNLTEIQNPGVTAQSRLSKARRTQILIAAVPAIIARGFCDTRIADIAEVAGTSPALVLYYFGSKDRLLAEALAFAEERFYSHVFRELAEFASARDQLVRLVELSCPGDRRSATEPLDGWVLWIEIWARAPRDPEVARDRSELDQRWRRAVVDIVREGQRQGEFRADIDAYDFALRFAALIDGLAVQVVLSDPDVKAAGMMEMCLRTAARELGFEFPRNEDPSSRSRDGSSDLSDGQA
jgi:AcrR family transcriptional regulator